MSAGEPPLDGARLAELAGRDGPALLRLARSLVHDDDRAADFVQATFLRALERRDQYRGGSAAPRRPAPRSACRARRE